MEMQNRVFWYVHRQWRGCLPCYTELDDVLEIQRNVVQYTQEIYALTYAKFHGCIGILFNFYKLKYNMDESIRQFVDAVKLPYDWLDLYGYNIVRVVLQKGYYHRNHQQKLVWDK